MKTFTTNWTDDRVWMQECGSRFLPAWYSFDQEAPWLFRLVWSGDWLCCISTYIARKDDELKLPLVMADICLFVCICTGKGDVLLSWFMFTACKVSTIYGMISIRRGSTKFWSIVQGEIVNRRGSSGRVLRCFRWRGGSGWRRRRGQW